MTMNHSPKIEGVTFSADLPDGYLLRPRTALARSTRNRKWSRDWYFMLRDLYVGGGYGWQRWGVGHMSSGITNALHKRGAIEIAESPKQPLIFRLTQRGMDECLGFLEDWMGADNPDFPEPPADAPTSFIKAVRSLDSLSDDDRFAHDMWVDELEAVIEAVKRHDTMAADPDDGPFVDPDDRKRYIARASQLRAKIADLRSAEAIR
jgi:hypothetical protein